MKIYLLDAVIILGKFLKMRREWEKIFTVWLGLVWFGLTPDWIRNEISSSRGRWPTSSTSLQRGSSRWWRRRTRRS
jgi:hypothetical protein